MGDVDYRVELSPDKVKTYHINMLKRYYKLTLAWRGPYKVVGIVGDVDYRVELSPDKVKT